MTGRPKIDLKKAEEFLLSNPVLLAVVAIQILLLTGTPERPAWLEDCPPVGGRRAGPWRGKGSFGKGFGPQTVRRR
jgi:hypothetical protein